MGLIELRVALGRDVWGRDLRFGCAQQVLFHGRLIEIWMIKPDGERPEKPVEIDQTAAGRCIKHVRAAAFFEIDYDLERVHQDMFLKYVQSPRTVLDGGFCFGNATPLF